MAQGTTVIGYSIECRRVNQSPSRELVTVPLTPAYDVGVDETQAQVTQGLGIYNHLCASIINFYTWHVSMIMSITGSVVLISLGLAPSLYTSLVLFLFCSC